MLSGLLKSRVAGGKKRDRRKNFSSLCGPKREKAITSEHSAAIKVFLFPVQIHNWMRSKQATWAWIIFEPIKTPATALHLDTPQPQIKINPRAQKLRCRDKILVIILGFCNSQQSYVCIVLPMTKTNTATAAKSRSRARRPVLKHFNLSLPVSAVFASKVGCECVRHTLRKVWASRPTEACVVSLNTVRSDSTNEIFKCSATRPASTQWHSWVSVVKSILFVRRPSSHPASRLHQSRFNCGHR